MRLILFLSRASSQFARRPMIIMIIRMMTRYFINSYFVIVRLDSRIKHGTGSQSTLRQAQGDNCHGELVEPWIPRSRDCVAIIAEDGSE